MNNGTELPAREAAARIVRALHDAGYTAYFAGGCVRDMLLGRTPDDFDVASNAPPERIQALFPKTVAVGAAFGVIQVIDGEIATEVATFRRDVGVADGRHPQGVEFCAAAEDARRRDFTINGLFYDPIANEYKDYVGGQEDLRAGVVRAIGDPPSRFREDYLRMLRAVRFASVLGFQIDPPTAAAIRELAPHISSISAERIQQELTRTLTESVHAGQAVRQWHELGLLEIVLPEVDALALQAQPPDYHPEGDVLTHTIAMLDGMSHPSVTLAYAVLLHDVGKPPTAGTATEEDGRRRITFHGHASKGAEMAVGILQRLRLPNRVIDDVAYCVRNHMRFMDVQRMRRSTLRELVSAPTFPDELELHRLDCAASHGSLENYNFLRSFLDELRNEPVLPAPWVTGHDIMALGVGEGPDVGRWHRLAYEAQLESRFANREELLAWLKQAIQDPR